MSVGLSVGRPQLFFEPLVWLGKKFSTKTGENEYVKILILEFRGYPPRVYSVSKSTLAYNSYKKYIFAKINLFSKALSWQNFKIFP
jgi:hypothetical protein